ncbi:hypothetical protein D3C87_1851110 [compost metagenome]
MLATVSASATDAPPCSRPKGWCTALTTGMLALTRCAETSSRVMPMVSAKVPLAAAVICWRRSSMAYRPF